MQRYFERISQAFYAAFTNAVDDGALDASLDPQAEASFFSSNVLGLFVMLRAKAPAAAVQSPRAGRARAPRLAGGLNRAACAPKEKATHRVALSLERATGFEPATSSLGS